MEESEFSREKNEGQHSGQKKQYIQIHSCVRKVYQVSSGTVPGNPRVVKGGLDGEGVSWDSRGDHGDQAQDPLPDRDSAACPSSQIALFLQGPQGMLGKLRGLYWGASSLWEWLSWLKQTRRGHPWVLFALVSLSLFNSPSFMNSTWMKTI